MATMPPMRSTCRPRTGPSPVCCIHEVSEWLNGQGANTVGFGKGGTLDLAGAKVTMVNAVHSASIDFAGKGRCRGDRPQDS
jgi:L-ascorbate metabolism protein UlaG (beta-lactamase superfamily)